LSSVVFLVRIWRHSSIYSAAILPAERRRVCGRRWGSTTKDDEADDEADDEEDEEEVEDDREQKEEGKRRRRRRKRAGERYAADDVAVQAQLFSAHQYR